MLYEAIARVSLGTVVTLQFLGPLALALLGVRRRLDGSGSRRPPPASIADRRAQRRRHPGVVLALGAAALTVLSLVMARRLATESAGLDGLAVAIDETTCMTLSSRSVKDPYA